MDNQNQMDREPTERELEILKILWRRREATVRQVYEELRERLPIVQNTVQAFLRTMEEKGFVRHRREGRTFIYEPTIDQLATSQNMASDLLKRVFDGAVDQLVQSVFSAKPPTGDELDRLEALIQQQKSNAEETTP
ncbi:MAG: BlaI/MecI/CopY family transcriptional regulator [Pirellulaceae bacterium]|jgi:predicted transcriptional regulator|nr:BlaI/MecI/CopY family transcriptional regulator [Pirellulaceae bacterium]MDP7014659.1 BlaI/MecI/CopY family transcriptional regulator [Pirellulaceae bacterium]